MFSENCFQELFSEQPVSGFAEADAAAADEETEDNKKEETFGKDEEGGDKEDKDYGDGDGDEGDSHSVSSMFPPPYLLSAHCTASLSARQVI